MIVSSEIISSIANDLRKSKEVKRAKKLVFYVSQRYWESDFSIIDGYSFEGLLQSLYENNPTRKDLKALLYHAVNTLNRKGVYSKIAQYILRRMSQLYNGTSEQSLNQYDTQTGQFGNQSIDRVVQNIQYHDESARMKKLIFAACKQYWENDINVIEMYDLRELLLELHELYPSLKRAKKALDNVVATINRQNFYSFIADNIVEELTYLYQYDSVEASHNNQVAEDEETHLIKANKNKANQEISETASITQSVELDSQATMVSENVLQTPSKKSEQKSEPEEVLETSPNSIPEGKVIPWLKIDNLFDLKQEIMQYTNPLRAKVMLFYAIYQIDISEQHWSIVRTCTLDDLLVRMFHHHGKDINKIENQLMRVANSSIEGLEPEDNVQAVSAIVESIKHFYRKT